MFESLSQESFTKTELPFNTDGFEFKKLKELDKSKMYRIYGFFITKSKKKGFGDTMNLISDGMFISLPSRYAEKFTNEEKSAFWSGKYSLCEIKEISTDSGNTCIFNMKETHPDYVAPTKESSDAPEIPFN